MTIDTSIVQQLMSQRMEGLSYKELAEKHSLSKSTVYKYCNQVDLPTEAKARLDRRSSENRKMFADRYASLKKLPKTSSWSLELSRIISHCIFDGSVTENMVNYTNSSKKLIDLFISDMKTVYDIDPTNVYTYPSSIGTKYIVCFCSQELVCDMKRYSISFNSTSSDTIIPSNVFSSSNDIIIEFLRAFWEDEGCITSRGDLLARIKNKGLRDQLLVLHDKLNISCSGYDCSDGGYGIRIKKEGIQSFKQISFRDSIISRGLNKRILKRDMFERHYGPVV